MSLSKRIHFDKIKEILVLEILEPLKNIRPEPWKSLNLSQREGVLQKLANGWTSEENRAGVTVEMGIDTPSRKAKIASEEFGYCLKQDTIQISTKRLRDNNPYPAVQSLIEGLHINYKVNAHAGHINHPSKEDNKQWSWELKARQLFLRSGQPHHETIKIDTVAESQEFAKQAIKDLQMFHSRNINPAKDADFDWKSHSKKDEPMNMNFFPSAEEKEQAKVAELQQEQSIPPGTKTQAPPEELKEKKEKKKEQKIVPEREIEM